VIIWLGVGIILSRNQAATTSTISENESNFS